MKRNFLSACSLVLAGLCVLLKYWPSDRWHWIASFVYFPPMVVVIWLTVHWIWFRRNFWFCVSFLLLTVTFVLWRENGVTCPSKRDPADVRIMHWNVWSIRKGLDPILQTVVHESPDVVCLNESKISRNAPTYPPYEKTMRTLTGTDWYSFNDSYMTIVSKYPFENKKVLQGFGYKALFATVRLEKPLTILLIDVSPNIGVSRKRTFLDLVRRVAELQPDVIAGDFNTPSHAVSLNPLWSTYVDTRCGLKYTWPGFFPMLRIDQILTRKSFSSVYHSQGYTSLSDHAWQTISLRF